MKYFSSIISLLYLLSTIASAFNIEEYINSLPLDTTEINISNKGLTYLPDLTRFKNLTFLNCSRNKLTQLQHLNKTLEILYCKENQLTMLPPLNNKLEILICYGNKLTELPPLNNKLRILDCQDNQLTMLPPLNNKLKYLCCSDNYFYNENNEKYKYDLHNINIIKTLRNFRYTYYALKYKKHFKRWLWEKVREPKIMKKFHPDHLNDLKDTDDLEVFLDDWIKK